MNELQALLETQWTRSNGVVDRSMVNYGMKSAYYVPVNDYYINVGDKPDIKKTLWYDDETEGPDASKFEAFREYNLQGRRLTFEEVTSYGRTDVYLYTNYITDRTGGKLKGWLTCRPGEEPRHVGEYRKATDDDIAAIKQGLAEMKAAYEKRLKTYWKRYSNKVYASGYWANR